MSWTIAAALRNSLCFYSLSTSTPSQCRLCITFQKYGFYHLQLVVWWNLQSWACWICCSAWSSHAFMPLSMQSSVVSCLCRASCASACLGSRSRIDCIVLAYHLPSIMNDCRQSRWHSRALCNLAGLGISLCLLGISWHLSMISCGLCSCFHSTTWCSFNA